MGQLCELPVGWRHVLVIDAPNHSVGELAALRDYVRQSLEGGVLVLPDDCPWSLEAMPELGAVRVEGEPRPPAAPPPAPEPEPPAAEPPPPPPEPEPPAAGPEGPAEKGPMDVSLHGGRNAEEKREIQLRLIAYRREHGLGCWAAVAKAIWGKLSDDQLRDMALGTVSLPISEWRLAAKALDKVERAAQSQ